MKSIKQNHKDDLEISGRYTAIGTKTVDEKRRLTVCEPLQAGYRVKIYKNEEDGTFLLVPMIEIPVYEEWLYKNKKALASVLQGIREAEEGKLRKFNLKTMKVE